ncbi:hypothetical protein [Cupriavidus sp. UME77]|uniref:hypothetical protein n=1 Tax=Cupriavidus sp. UME77 TaxID=1862321 RepID=UPI0016023C4A|nr:hypothetical protein [Cupriavidus sp. UME77]
MRGTIDGLGRLLANPTAWEALIASATVEQRERLASAYEKADAKEIGRIGGELVTYLPFGGAAGVVKTATTAAEEAAKAAALGKGVGITDAKGSQPVIGAGGAIDGFNAAQGVVASRINVRTGDAAVKSSGLEYAWAKHGGAWGQNKSAFTISKDELNVFLQDPLVVKTPAYQSPTSGNFIRTVDFGRPVGVDAKVGGKSTNFMTVITDKKGNLVNVFPGKTF